MFSTASPSTGSGGKGLVGGSPIFPSPTKTQYNGLTGEELGTEIHINSAWIMYSSASVFRLGDDLLRSESG